MNIQIEKELEYLVNKTGKETTLLLAEAVKEGIHALYKKYITEAYMLEKIDRKEAVELLGATLIDELDYAWRSIENDIKWGMKVG
ncbi:MAG: hypothetical protein SCARUB_00013 [Candidatus Scalindua rubra]|uniref:Uncharacterized protein n=1 Tax=Candidatus Scalindua rubra TaxID=1872076 RepID=A0A1E3XGJ1_9BACT|nr:MAG: hypothetical protein SCARUB_00013 [Candidatus Scalindua rubra]